MSRKLRLTATGETLIWYVSLTVDEMGMREYHFLAADDADECSEEWLAVLLPDGEFKVYRQKANDFLADWDDLVTPLLEGPYNDIPAAQHFCESALIEAGVAYVLNIEDDDGAFPSD